MASLRSRNKAAGLQAGFFGQLNANTARRKTLAENMARMQEQQKRELAKSDYERAANAKEAKETQRLTAVAAGQTSGGFETQAAIELGDSIRNLNPKAKRIAITNKALQLKTLATEGRGNALVTGVEDDISVSTAQARNPEDPTQSPPSPGVQSPATREPAIQGIQGSAFDPLALPTSTGLKQAQGDFVNAKGDRVPATFDPSTGRNFTADPVTGEKDFNITPEQPEDTAERVDGRIVHLLDRDTGKIDTSQSFDVRFNKKTQTTEIEIAPGKWIDKPSNTVIADKTKGRGVEGAIGDVEFSDKETTQLQYTGSALSTLDRLAKTSQLRDRGIVAGAQRLYNSFDEMLIANGIKGDNTTTLLQFMAQHDEDALAAGLGEEMQLTDEEKVGLTTYFRQGKTGPQDAAYMKGAINALKKLVPLQIVRAMSDNPRPSQTLISAVSDIIQGKPIGTELAGAVGEFRRSVVGRERSIYDLKYTPDATPRKLKNAGWLFTGKVFKDENDKFRYAIKHESGRTTGIPVRMNPSVEQLNAWLNK